MSIQGLLQKGEANCPILEKMADKILTPVRAIWTGRRVEVKDSAIHCSYSNGYSVIVPMPMKGQVEMRVRGIGGHPSTFLTSIALLPVALFGLALKKISLLTNEKSNRYHKLIEAVLKELEIKSKCPSAPELGDDLTSKQIYEAENTIYNAEREIPKLKEKMEKSKKFPPLPMPADATPIEKELINEENQRRTKKNQKWEKELLEKEKGIENQKKYLEELQNRPDLFNDPDPDAINGVIERNLEILNQKPEAVKKEIQKITQQIQENRRRQDDIKRCAKILKIPLDNDRLEQLEDMKFTVYALLEKRNEQKRELKRVINAPKVYIQWQSAHKKTQEAFSEYLKSAAKS